MIPDPTDEIRAIKHKLAVACGNDIHRIAEEARRHQRESGRQAIAIPRRQSAATSTTNNRLQPSGGSGRP